MALGQGMPSGSMDAVTAALERRSQGGSTPALNQQTSQAPTSPNIPYPNIPSGGSGIPKTDMGSSSEPDGENTLIIKAFSKYLNRFN